MGRTTVRGAIQAYLANAGIKFLGNVYAHPPKITSEAEFFETVQPGTASGALIYIHLEQQHEKRIALGGPTSGQKLRPYQVLLICLLRSKKADTEQVGADNDTFLDSLVSAIEANRNAGSPSTVFQWGEGDTTGAVDIQVTATLPRPLRLQSSQVYSEVRVTAVEIVNT